MQPLRELRLSSDLTQKELAQRINIPVGIISQLENGVPSDHYSYLTRLSRFFHVTVDFLLNNKSPFMPPDHQELFHIYQSLDDISKGKLYVRAISIAEESTEKKNKEF